MHSDQSEISLSILTPAGDGRVPGCGAEPCFVWVAESVSAWGLAGVYRVVALMIDLRVLKWGLQGMEPFIGRAFGRSVLRARGMTGPLARAQRARLRAGVTLARLDRSKVARLQQLQAPRRRSIAATRPASSHADDDAAAWRRGFIAPYSCPARRALAGLVP
uniref:Uncharacterized protein n=1 Tax=mine drainage metagenome TaxID=410659 RepID=E6PNK1_9ZZZZ